MFPRHFSLLFLLVTLLVCVSWLVSGASTLSESGLHTAKSEATPDSQQNWLDLLSVSSGVPAEAVDSGASCAAVEVPLNLGDPSAVVHDPLHNYVYVLRTGVTEPQAAVLRYGREVTRITFPTSPYGELTSVGVNPVSGVTYVTQWHRDEVHIMMGTQAPLSWYQANWGPAGVWPSLLTTYTHVSGKWGGGTGWVLRFAGTTELDEVEVGPNANSSAGVVADHNQYLYLANSYSDTVSILDGGSLLDTIDVGDHRTALVAGSTFTTTSLPEAGTS